MEDINKMWPVADVWEEGNEIEFTVNARSIDDDTRWGVGCKTPLKSDVEPFLIAAVPPASGSSRWSLTLRATLTETEEGYCCEDCGPAYSVVQVDAAEVTISKDEMEEWSPWVRLISKSVKDTPAPVPMPEPGPETFTLELTRDQLDAVTALSGACNSSGIESGLYWAAQRAGGSSAARVQRYDGSSVDGALRVVRQDPFPF